jgi:deoxyribose-phosphate aldolase
MTPPSPADIAARIDHTLLKAEATITQVDQLIDEAITHHFASVCLNPMFVAHAAGRLHGSGVKTCTVAGFPLGANVASVKAIDAATAVRHGADEVDMVCHLPWLMDCDHARLCDEIRRVVDAAGAERGDAIVKVIVESALLMNGVDVATAERRIETACRAVRDAGAAFIKTSTGFHAAGGATIQAVALMRKHGAGIRVKAAGGIRNLDDALKMIGAGADRLGCSAGVQIVTGGAGNAGY